MRKEKTRGARQPLPASVPRVRLWRPHGLRGPGQLETCPSAAFSKLRPLPHIRYLLPSYPISFPHGNLQVRFVRAQASFGTELITSTSPDFPAGVCAPRTQHTLMTPTEQPCERHGISEALRNLHINRQNTRAISHHLGVLPYFQGQRLTEAARPTGKGTGTGIRWPGFGIP